MFNNVKNITEIKSLTESSDYAPEQHRIHFLFIKVTHFILNIILNLMVPSQNQMKIIKG